MAGALGLDCVVDRLVEDLRERGIVSGERPPDPELVELLIDSHVHDPAPQPAAGGAEAS